MLTECLNVRINAFTSHLVTSTPAMELIVSLVFQILQCFREYIRSFPAEKVFILCFQSLINSKSAIMVLLQT